MYGAEVSVGICMCMYVCIVLYPLIFLVSTSSATTWWSNNVSACSQYQSKDWFFFQNGSYLFPHSGHATHLLGLYSWSEFQNKRHPQCILHPDPIFTAFGSPYFLGSRLKMLSHFIKTGVWVSPIFLIVFTWFQRREGSKDVLTLTY